MTEQSVTKSPVVGGVQAVFVHVKNLKSSIEWYSNLLGIPTPENQRSDIHIFGLENGANIFLVKSDEVVPSRHVLCSLSTPDLEEAKRYFEENSIEIVYKDEETINFKDLDGNILMACSI